MATASDTDGGAILHPRTAPFLVDRIPPSEQVARFVDHYWLVRWQLDPGEEHHQRVLTHPVVNVVITGRRTEWSGLVPASSNVTSPERAGRSG